jgi:hypothetical protein
VIRTLAHTAAAVLCAALAGCGAHITPPAFSSLDEPAVVILTDYGRHSSLILPREGAAAEFAYGQLGWYALNKRAWWRSPAATLLPNPGAFGTRTLAASPDREPPPDGPAMQHTYAIAVERAGVDRLLRELDARFAAGAGPTINNPESGLLFVRDGHTYWVLNNCNTEVARWLRTLGCRVDGPSVWAKFTFAPPGPLPQGALTGLSPLTRGVPPYISAAGGREGTEIPDASSVQAVVP